MRGHSADFITDIIKEALIALVLGPITLILGSINDMSNIVFVSSVAFALYAFISLRNSYNNSDHLSSDNKRSEQRANLDSLQGKIRLLAESYTKEKASAPDHASLIRELLTHDIDDYVLLRIPNNSTAIRQATTVSILLFLAGAALFALINYTNTIIKALLNTLVQIEPFTGMAVEDIAAAATDPVAKLLAVYSLLLNLLALILILVSVGTFFEQIGGCLTRFVLDKFFRINANTFNPLSLENGIYSCGPFAIIEVSRSHGARASRSSYYPGAILAPIERFALFRDLKGCLTNGKNSGTKTEHSNPDQEPKLYVYSPANSDGIETQTHAQIFVPKDWARTNEQATQAANIEGRDIKTYEQLAKNLPDSCTCYVFSRNGVSSLLLANYLEKQGFTAYDLGHEPDNYAAFERVCLTVLIKSKCGIIQHQITEEEIKH